MVSRRPKTALDALMETELPILERYGLMVPHASASPTRLRASWNFGVKPSFPARRTMTVVRARAFPRYWALISLERLRQRPDCRGRLTATGRWRRTPREGFPSQDRFGGR